MDVKHTLDRLYNDPPDLDTDACLDVWAKPFFLTMRIFGIFFDAYHYPEAKRRFAENFGKQKMSSTVPGVEPNANEDIPQTDADDAERGHEQRGRTTSEKHVDNFVPSLLRHCSRVLEDQELEQVLTNGEEVQRVVGRCGRLVVVNMHSSKPSMTPSSVFAFSRKSFRGGRFYAMIVCCVFWANVVRAITFIGNPKLSWSSGCGEIMFYLMVALNSLILFVSCSKKSHFTDFFVKWKLLFGDLTSRRLGLKVVAQNSNIKLVTAFFWVLASCNVGFIVFIALSGYKAGGAEMILLIDGAKGYSIALSIVLSCYCSFAWAMPVMFIYVVCRYISAHFRHFTDVLKLHIEAAGGHIPIHFRELRERHLVMCNLTAIIDKYIRVSLAVTNGANVVTACVLLYQVIVKEADSSAYCSLLFWFVTAIVNTLLVTYSAANVNIAMLSALYELQTLQTSHITPDQQTQLHLFMATLNGPDLGFTILGVILVKKELIFTLFGLFLTYAVVLIQFK